jgi:signal transduction histidine kinase
MTIGETQTIALLRSDGTFLMREPQVPTAQGQSVADSPLFHQHLPRSSQGTFVTVSRIDGRRRIISYAAITGYPLVVTVGLAEDEALADWRRQLIATSATFVVFLAILALVTFLLVVRLERDEVRRRDIEMARRDADAANRAKTDFLSNMSHELRTPLNAILGYAEVIRDQQLGLRRDELHRAYAGNIHAAGTHLLTLINGLLDLSKIEAGRWALHDEPIALGRVASQALRQQRLIAEQSGIELALTVSPDLPLLRADEQAVVQMLLNLVSNALKFTPHGGRIDVSVHRHAAGLALTVRDTGIGIAPEVQARLFERFTQSADPLVRTNRGKWAPRSCFTSRPRACSRRGLPSGRTARRARNVVRRAAPPG